MNGFYMDISHVPFHVSEITLMDFVWIRYSMRFFQRKSFECVFFYGNVHEKSQLLLVIDEIYLSDCC